MIIQDEKLLRRVSKKTSPKDCKQGEIFERILLALVDHPTGLGLSAIQIGEPIRAGIITLADGSKLKMVNPEMLSKRKEATFRGEGCLSFPGKYVNTTRFYEVTVKWVDENGTKHKAVFTGMEALQIQHEIDHMDGILYFDRQLKPYIRKSKKIGRNEPCPYCMKNRKFIKYKKCEEHFEK